MAARMHADEVDLDVPLVRRLVAGQFPRWADLPVTPVPSSGTDHAMFRLGADLVVRLPRIPNPVLQVEKEHRWLPVLGPRLPLAVPVPHALGAPGEGYPFPWSVYGWLPGETVTLDRVADPATLARDLAGFVAALRRIDPAGGPAPGRHNFFRGVPLVEREHWVRPALAALADDAELGVDVAAATAAWEAALRAPVWDRPPVWLHGDLAAGNLLAADGRVTAVIDFGGLGVGDPACDLMVAWSLLPADARAVFRDALDVDDATWARARGWALSVALVALPYYRDTNPEMVRASLHTVRAVLADAGPAVTSRRR